MKAWKDAEYRAARALGGKRIVLSGGRGSRTKGDVELPGWHVEVKYRQRFAVYSMFREVEKAAQKEGKNPLLIITEKNKPGQLAVIRIEYFRESKEEAEIERNGEIHTAGGTYPDSPGPIGAGDSHSQAEHSPL